MKKLIALLAVALLFAGCAPKHVPDVEPTDPQILQVKVQVNFAVAKLKHLEKMLADQERDLERIESMLLVLRKYSAHKCD